MKKYLFIARAMWDEILTYRLNFSVWRMRNVLQLLTVYFLWYAILPSGKSLGGYSQQQMLTYILGTALIGAIVYSTRTGTVGDQINNGEMSNFLIKPMSMFLYWFSRDIGDKAMNIVFSIVEISLVFAVLRPPIFLQQNIFYIFASVIAIIFAILINFYFSLLLGFIGFWSSETWAPRFIFFTLLNFFAGGLFPLDILPKQIFAIIQLFPFTYMVYLPIKMYLGQVQILVIIQSLTLSFLWVAILYVATRFTWLRGLRSYSAQGR